MHNGAQPVCNQYSDLVFAGRNIPDGIGDFFSVSESSAEVAHQR
jgi:hypothetical protein